MHSSFGSAPFFNSSRPIVAAAEITGEHHVERSGAGNDATVPIQTSITMLEIEIAKGEGAYTRAELDRLERKRDEAKGMLHVLMLGGKR
ncbi:hypothetical protein GEO60473_20530 [Geobacter sp. 60473]|nr:hypothetical protein GEO60473_20530 [Geobacter sp. 60473]